MSGRTDRRAFLVRTLALAAAASLPCCGGAPPAAEQVAEWLPDEDAVRRLGQAWLESQAGGRSAEDLAGELAAAAGDLAGPGGRDRLLAALQADHGAGRILVLSGWVLSETEARLCALAALATSPSTAG